MTQDRFVDHYDALQLAPSADPETIERVFRLLAKRYHPDNRLTGDPERFNAVSEAHKVLSDPKERARYDARYESDRREQWSLFFEAPLAGEDENQRTQRWILSLLYKLRRRDPENAGMGEYEMENYLDVADSELDFNLWYLKEKGRISRTQTGQWAITVEGVDWIIQEDHVFRKDRLIGDGTPSQPGSDSSRDEPPGTLPPHLEDPPDSEEGAS